MSAVLGLRGLLRWCRMRMRLHRLRRGGMRLLSGSRFWLLMIPFLLLGLMAFVPSPVVSALSVLPVLRSALPFVPA